MVSYNATPGKSSNLVPSTQGSTESRVRVEQIRGYPATLSLAITPNVQHLTDWSTARTKPYALFWVRHYSLFNCGACMQGTRSGKAKRYAGCHRFNGAIPLPANVARDMQSNGSTYGIMPTRTTSERG